MRRREFIAMATSAAFSWPPAARAQHRETIHRLAIVDPAFPVADLSEKSEVSSYRAFFKELRRLGYIEGQIS
jgi:putative ABC transport system substrate-binding protein